MGAAAALPADDALLVEEIGALEQRKTLLQAELYKRQTLRAQREHADQEAARRAIPSATTLDAGRALWGEGPTDKQIQTRMASMVYRDGSLLEAATGEGRMRRWDLAKLRELLARQGRRRGAVAKVGAQARAAAP